MGLDMGKDGSIFYVLHFFHVCVGQPLYLTDAWAPGISVPISVAHSCVYVMVLL